MSIVNDASWYEGLCRQFVDHVQTTITSNCSPHGGRDYEAIGHDVCRLFEEFFEENLG